MFIKVMGPNAITIDYLALISLLYIHLKRQIADAMMYLVHKSF